MLATRAYNALHTLPTNMDIHSSKSSTKLSKSKVMNVSGSLNASFTNLLQDVHSMYIQGSFRASFFRMKTLRRQKVLHESIDPVTRHGQHFQMLATCLGNEDAKSRIATAPNRRTMTNFSNGTCEREESRGPIKSARRRGRRRQSQSLGV